MRTEKSKTGLKQLVEYINNISPYKNMGMIEIGSFDGSAGNETLRHIIPISRTSVQAQEGRSSIVTKFFAANARISCALRGSPNAVESCVIKLSGHTY